MVVEPAVVLDETAALVPPKLMVVEARALLRVKSASTVLAIEPVTAVP